MGVISRALSVISSKIKANRGAFDVNEMEHLQPLGDDSKPLANDDGWSDRTSKNGNDVYFGAFDYENKVANQGEKRIYARNSSGISVNQVYLKSNGEIEQSNNECTLKQMHDGSFSVENSSVSISMSSSGDAEIKNSSGFIKLLSDGSVNINGFIISATGTAVDSSGIGLNTHSHTQGQDSAGNTQARTDQASNP